MIPRDDAVVMVERTERRDGGKAVEIQVTVDPGNHVRTVGEDLHAGQRVFGAGDELTPARLGVVASLGVDALDVHPRPRGGGMSTCDAVLTSGGVSMGDIDLVKVVLDRIGDMRWMQVAIRPAKPLAFGVVRPEGPGRREVPVFGLPGNPVSSLVSFELFARPGVRRLAGHPHPYLHRPRLLATADEALSRRPDGKVHFVRVVATAGERGVLHVRSSGGQGSHQLAAMARANALAVVPDGEGLRLGGQVEIMLLEEPPTQELT